MSYHRRYKLKDNRFGLLALTMRERVGLTQAEVAGVLAVSERTIRHWEGGTAYPSTANLKELIALYLQHGAFMSGRERTEAKAFWEQAIESAARRKSLFDDVWFDDLLQQYRVQAPRERTDTQQEQHRADWGEATDVTVFCGREQELATLKQWVLRERCRVVVLQGMGGIGKTTLSIRFTQGMMPHFQIVFWRTLRNAPPLNELLSDCIHRLSRQQDALLPISIDDKINALVELLRQQRCLLVLDNVETLLEAGSLDGRYRKGYEGYGTLILRVAETAHQSCLLLTTREMLIELEPLEGTHTVVQALKLSGLGQAASRDMLRDKELFGEQEDWERFVQHYSGNPLALKIVAATIRELFGGDIAAFAGEGAVIPHTVQQLLAYQFARLSPLERDVMYWLAIERDLVSYETLSKNLALTNTIEKRSLLMALKSLRRRCLVERGERGAVFTLQPVVMEYISEQLVEQIGEEIIYSSPLLLLTHALMKAQSKDYIRESQTRMLVQPVLKKLTRYYKDERKVGSHLKSLLQMLREKPGAMQGYGGGNLLNLLVGLNGHLREIDCSTLVIRQAYLQGIEAQDANFAGAQIVESLFTEPVESIASMVLSPDGRYLAIGSFSGQIRVWKVADGQLLFNLKGHCRVAWTLAFSPDSRRLASGGYDGWVKLWSVDEEDGLEASGRCLSAWQAHDSWVRSVAFSADGRVLVTGGDDEIVRVWEIATGTCVCVMRGHRGMIWSVAISADGTRLVTGGDDEVVRVWEIATGTCLHELDGHCGTILSVAFHPSGALFASGEENGHIKLWDTSSGRCLAALRLRTRRAASIAFNQEGTLLASGSYDGTVEVWWIEGTSGPRHFRTLHGHSTWVSAITFGPGGLLASIAYNGNVKLWDVEHGTCLRTFQGYSSVISALAFSPDGNLLVHGDNNGLLKVWEVAEGGESRCVSTFQGHVGRIWSVAFSPDGKTFATGGDDLLVKLWVVEPRNGQCLKLFRGQATMAWSVAFSPDGKWLASSGFDHTVKLWEVNRADGVPWILDGHATFVWSVAFSPDGKLLASGDNDGEVRLWEVESKACLKSLSNRNRSVMALAFNADGTVLLGTGSDETVMLWRVEQESSGYCQPIEEHVPANWARAMAFNRDGTTLATGSDGHTVRVWHVDQQRNTVHSRTFARGGGQVWSVAFSRDNRLLASGDDDGTLVIWDLEKGICRQILRSDRPYERMNIRGLTGITDAQRGSLAALGAREDV